MPPEAKIFFVEDNDNSREMCTEILKRNGHTVVDIATNLKDAIEKIPNLSNLGINIAIVDGNLSENSQGGSDGEFVIRTIKKQHPTIIVIGHSLDKLLNGADINCTKEEGNQKLVEVVNNA